MTEPKDFLPIRWRPGMLARSKYFEHSDRRAILLAALLGRNGSEESGIFFLRSEDAGDLVTIDDAPDRRKFVRVKRSFCALTRDRVVLVGSPGDGPREPVRLDGDVLICAAQAGDAQAAEEPVPADAELQEAGIYFPARVELKVRPATELTRGGIGQEIPLMRVRAPEEGQPRYLPPVLRLEVVSRIDASVLPAISSRLQELESLARQQSSVSMATGLGPLAAKWAAEMLILRSILLGRCAATRNLGSMTPQSFHAEIVAPLVTWFSDYKAVFPSATDRALLEAVSSASSLEQINSQDLSLGVGNLLYGFDDFLRRLCFAVEPGLQALPGEGQ